MGHLQITSGYNRSHHGQSSDQNPGVTNDRAPQRGKTASRGNTISSLGQVTTSLGPQGSQVQQQQGYIHIRVPTKCEAAAGNGNLASSLERKSSYDKSSPSS